MVWHSLKVLDLEVCWSQNLVSIVFDIVGYDRKVSVLVEKSCEPFTLSLGKLLGLFLLELLLGPAIDSFGLLCDSFLWHVESLVALCLFTILVSDYSNMDQLIMFQT